MQSIVLDNTITTDPSVYTYENYTFFSIAGDGFGNEHTDNYGNPHNYHFTCELHTAFTYNGGETSSFLGDDDLWVFIGDDLVIDLGGLHTAMNASVDLDTLGLIPGDSYNLDLFFAERHTVESNFRIDTSIELASQTPIPEPATMTLLGLGLSGFAIRRLRKAA